MFLRFGGLFLVILMTAAANAWATDDTVILARIIHGGDTGSDYVFVVNDKLRVTGLAQLSKTARQLYRGPIPVKIALRSQFRIDDKSIAMLMRVLAADQIKVVSFIIPVRRVPGWADVVGLPQYRDALATSPSVQTRP